MQRNSLQLQEQNFLTSGVKAHLGGLGGKWAVASNNILPLYSHYYILPLVGRWVWGEKKGEKIDGKTSYNLLFILFQERSFPIIVTGSYKRAVTVIINLINFFTHSDLTLFSLGIKLIIMYVLGQKNLKSQKDQNFLIVILMNGLSSW